MTDDKKTGYGRPPAEHRFRSGVSGNPKGRPKRAKNLKTDLQEELAERVNITENGRPLKISKQRLMLKAMTTKAVKGDTRAASIVISLVAQTMGLDAQNEAKNVLSLDDKAILTSWLDRQLGSDRTTKGVVTERDLSDDE